MKDMEQGEVAIGLDIGTTKIVAIVGRKNDHDKIEIIGFGKAKSLGVQRGVVSNITQTIESIHHAVKEAEADSGLDLNHCVVGIAASIFDHYSIVIIFLGKMHKR